MHIPVLLPEVLEALAINPSGTYVDLTFGEGGHARPILERLSRGGHLLAFDQDEVAAQAATQFQKAHFTFFRTNFRFMRQFLLHRGIDQVDGILADLGVASSQIDTPERGFSTRWNGELDMRMDQASSLNAQEIINNSSRDQLAWLLHNYGEVRGAHRLAQAIVAARAVQPIQTTQDLRATLQRWAPKGREAKYFAQIFQAFRIEVNDELGALKEMLKQSASLLRTNARLVILSYHSLEDRLVKTFLKTGNFEGNPEKDIYGNVVRPFDPVYKKPVRPSENEIHNNNRSRSARLRVGEKR